MVIIGLATMPVTNLLAHLMAVTSELNPNKTQRLQKLEESGEAEERLCREKRSHSRHNARQENSTA